MRQGKRIEEMDLSTLPFRDVNMHTGMHARVHTHTYLYIRVEQDKCLSLSFMGVRNFWFGLLRNLREEGQPVSGLMSRGRQRRTWGGMRPRKLDQMPVSRAF